MTWLSIVAIHTAANEPPKVRQVMNKIHRDVAVNEFVYSSALGDMCVRASCTASCTQPAAQPAAQPEVVVWPHVSSWAGETFAYQLSADLLVVVAGLPEQLRSLRRALICTSLPKGELLSSERIRPL